MNTPAHAIVNLALLGGGKGRDFAPWILAGAVIPDAPMFLFFVWQHFVEGAPQALIWGDLYFRAEWQAFFDWFNSIPLAVAGALVAYRLGHRGWLVLFASVALHAVLDLPLHHEDAHRHFYPLSDWQFRSPVSYWNPARLGIVGAGFEVGAVAVGSVLLWRRHPGKRVRMTLVGLSALYVVGYVGFYLR